MARFGAPADLIERHEAAVAREEDAFEIWPDNEKSLRLFLGLATQWRRAGYGGHRVGLDYPAIEPTARLMGIRISTRRFEDLRRMEAAALNALAERTAQEARRGADDVPRGGVGRC